MDCPKCGTENSPQSRFCRNCGFDIKSVTVETPGQPVVPPMPSTEVPVTTASAPISSGETPQNPVQPEIPVTSIQSPVLGTPANPLIVSIVPTFPPYAGFWLRFVAALIDGLLILAVSTPFFIINGVLGFLSQRNADLMANFGFSLLIDISLFIVQWLYYSLMESSSKQGTLGKMALGLKVTDLNGNRISFGRATGRYFGRILSGIILDVGFLMIAFTDKKQGLHDIIAGTLVVKK